MGMNNWEQDCDLSDIFLQSARPLSGSSTASSKKGNKKSAKKKNTAQSSSSPSSTDERGVSTSPEVEGTSSSTDDKSVLPLAAESTPQTTQTSSTGKVHI